MVSRLNSRWSWCITSASVPATKRGDELGFPTRQTYMSASCFRGRRPSRGKDKSRPLRDHPEVAHSGLPVRSVTPSHFVRTAAKFTVMHFQGEYLYCFSQTVTLLKAEPSGLVPLALIVSILPSLETSNFVDSACLPPLMKFASIVLALIFFVEMVSALLGIAPIGG